MKDLLYTLVKILFDVYDLYLIQIKSVGKYPFLYPSFLDLDPVNYLYLWLLIVS